MHYGIDLRWLTSRSEGVAIAENGFDEAGIHWSVTDVRKGSIRGLAERGAAVEITGVAQPGSSSGVTVAIDDQPIGTYRVSEEVGSERLREILDGVVRGIRVREGDTITAARNALEEQSRRRADEALDHFSAYLASLDVVSHEPVPVARLLETPRTRHFRIGRLDGSLSDGYFTLSDPDRGDTIRWMRSGSADGWGTSVCGHATGQVNVRDADGRYEVETSRADLAAVTRIVAATLALRQGAYLAKLDREQARGEADRRATVELAQAGAAARSAKEREGRYAEITRLDSLLGRLY